MIKSPQLKGVYSCNGDGNMVDGIVTSPKVLRYSTWTVNVKLEARVMKEVPLNI
jgi:hypothetical protein